MSEVEIDAYNIEAKYLDKILEFVETDLDSKLTNFLDIQNTPNTHDLLNSLLILLNKLSRSARIGKKFYTGINKDLVKFGELLEKGTTDSSNLLKIVNKINHQMAIAHFFTKPSIEGAEMKVEGPGKDE